MLAQITGISDPNPLFPETGADFLGTITSQVLLYDLIIAAFYFFIRLILGGFNLLTAGGDPAKIQAGQSVITSALIGLIIVVSAYFIGQILKSVFGVNIPGL